MQLFPAGSDKVVISGVRILLEGLPEQVQRVADALDEALPGRVVWSEVALPGLGNIVGLEGIGVPFEAIDQSGADRDRRAKTSGRSGPGATMVPGSPSFPRGVEAVVPDQDLLPDSHPAMP